MARGPDDDPRITDLRRYRKAREQAKRQPPPKPKRPSEGFLGSNPRAGLILAIVAVVLAALYVVPMFL
ncbi:hypothetical protein LRS10_09955 [Phenylobacterium sp. J426]|uniref:hypothetical protein n=1 Tax=Phenylobacterium sp. J426 TaxID=2898439 RepID=UPI002150D35B|nr:hypothetical protein [Phenylobacterium sp. J426]MCR5874465.1 hypothetical protein [Phenylobacterium sp. J426]